MAPEPKEKDAHRNEFSSAADMAQADAAHREAYDYWGYLFKADKCGTPLLDRLLKGIAMVIVSLTLSLYNLSSSLSSLLLLLLLLLFLPRHLTHSVFTARQV